MIGDLLVAKYLFKESWIKSIIYWLLLIIIGIVLIFVSTPLAFITGGIIATLLLIIKSISKYYLIKIFLGEDSIAKILLGIILADIINIIILLVLITITVALGMTTLTEIGTGLI